jgi:hypothetical protein
VQGVQGTQDSLPHISHALLKAFLKFCHFNGREESHVTNVVEKSRVGVRVSVTEVLPKAS